MAPHTTRKTIFPRRLSQAPLELLARLPPREDRVDRRPQLAPVGKPRKLDHETALSPAASALASVNQPCRRPG
jgi:hypothetical protein